MFEKFFLGTCWFFIGLQVLIFLCKLGDGYVNLIKPWEISRHWWESLSWKEKLNHRLEYYSR